MKGLEMAENLRVSVRKQIDRLGKDRAAATARVAALREEIRRHERVYEILDGRKTGKRAQRSHQLVISAEKRWRQLRGFGQLADPVAKVKLVDGIDERGVTRNAA